MQQQSVHKNAHNLVHNTNRSDQGLNTCICIALAHFPGWLQYSPAHMSTKKAAVPKACAIKIKETSSTKQSQISPLKNERYEKNKNICCFRYGHSAKSLIDVVWMAHQKLGMDTDLQTLPIPLLQFHPKRSHLVIIWFKWYQRDYASSHLAILCRHMKKKQRLVEEKANRRNHGTVNCCLAHSLGHHRVNHGCLHQETKKQGTLYYTNLSSVSSLSSGNKCGTGVAGGEKSDWQCVPCVPCLGAVWCRWWWWGR